MLWRGLFLTGLLLSSITVLPGLARADEPAAPGEPPAADDSEEAFKKAVRDAVRDMNDKKLDRACPVLRDSYRRDPQPVVLFHLAECEEKLGNVATALAHYEKYLDVFDKMSPDEQKEEAAHEEQATARREALVKVLPKITLKLPEGAPPGTKVTRTSRDGVQVPLALNLPLVVDPGEVVLRVQAPGRRDVDLRVVVKQGEQKTVEVPMPPADKSTDRVARVGKPLEPVPSYLPALEGDSQGQRIGAYVAAGVGVAGIAVGAIAGAYTWGQKGIIEDSCRGKLCSPKGEEAKDTAATYGTVSTVTFVVGGVALATGVVLYLTAPAPAKLSAVPSRVTARPSGLEVTWQW